jgi:hypothetical protein
MSEIPDLRNLRLEVPTPTGTYAPGLVVEVLETQRMSQRVRVCLDGPGRHLGACHRVWVPMRAVTSRVHLPARDGLRLSVTAWDVAAA